MSGWTDFLRTWKDGEGPWVVMAAVVTAVQVYGVVVCFWSALLFILLFYSWMLLIILISLMHFNDNLSPPWQNTFNLCLPLTEDLADDLEDIDFDAPADDEGWETEDEMEAEQDDSELTFSKHKGSASCPDVLLRHVQCLNFILITLLSRFCVLRELGSSDKQPGSNRRRRWQGLCLEGERWGSSVWVHRWVSRAGWRLH